MERAWMGSGFPRPNKSPRRKPGDREQPAHQADNLPPRALRLRAVHAAWFGRVGLRPAERCRQRATSGEQDRQGERRCHPRSQGCGLRSCDHPFGHRADDWLRSRRSGLRHGWLGGQCHRRRAARRRFGGPTPRWQKTRQRRHGILPAAIPAHGLHAPKGLQGPRRFAQHGLHQGVGCSPGIGMNVGRGSGLLHHDGFPRHFLRPIRPGNARRHC